MIKIDITKWDFKLIFSGVSLLVSCIIMPIIFIVTLNSDVKAFRKEFKEFKASNAKELVGIQGELGELRRLHLSNKVAILENKQEVHSNLSKLERNSKRLETAVAAIVPPR